MNKKFQSRALPFLQWGIDNPIPINLLLILLTILGLLAIFSLEREIFPSFSFDIIEVSVDMERGGSPEQIDQQINQVLFSHLKSVDGVRKITTLSVKDRATLFIEVEKGALLQKVKNAVENEIELIKTLPKESDIPKVSEVTFPNDAVFLAFTSESLSQADVHDFSQKFSRRLKDEQIASQVDPLFEFQRELLINISRNTLLGKEMTLKNLSKAIYQQNVEKYGGKLREEKEILIKGTKRKEKKEEIASLPIRFSNGESLSLNELVGKENITQSFVEDSPSLFFNGKTADVLVIKKGENEDIIDLCNRVKQYVHRHDFPREMTADLFFDRSVFVTSRIYLIVKNAAFGFLLILVVLSLFLKLEIAFWVSLGIAFSFVGGCLCLYMTNTSINMLSLFGFLITTGIIVDDAIVIGENFSRLRSKGMKPKQAAMDTLHALAWPVFCMMSTTLLAFLPLLFVSGIFGKFISVLPIAVMGALLFSLFESLFILPVHLAHHTTSPCLKSSTVIAVFCRRITSLQQWVEKKLTAFLARYLLPSVAFTLKNRCASILFLLTVTLFSLTLIPAGWVKKSIFPKVDGEILIANFAFYTGTNKETSEKEGKKILQALFSTAKEIEKRDGINPLVHSLLMSGTAINHEGGGTLLFSPHMGQIQVELLSIDNGRTVTAREFISLWREHIPFQANRESLSFQEASGPSSNRPIDIYFFSPDEESLFLIEEKFRHYLQQIQGVVDIGSDRTNTIPTLHVKLKKATHPLPLTEEEILTAIQDAYHGIRVNTFYDNEEEIHFVLRLPAEERDSLYELKQFPLTPHLRLEQVADLTLVEEVAMVRRVDGNRQVNVYAAIDSSFSLNESQLRSQIERQFLSQIQKIHPKVSWKYSGEVEDGQEAMSSLKRAFLPVCFAIYFLLATLFRSYWQPLVVMSAIPFGLVGALFGHLIMGKAFSMMSGFGLVSVLGIVVNDSLVLIDAINTFLREGVPLHQALLYAVQRRFRSIFLTTVTTAVGMTPLLFETSLQAQFLIPFVVSLVFGIPCSSFCILFFLPIMYSFIYREKWERH